jgi:CSLREA domain-containing protein
MRIATPPVVTRFLALLLFGALCWAGAATTAQAQQTFQVDSRGDGGDSNPGDGTCDNGSGACTLRAAIEEANADGDTDTIEFGSIPVTGGFATITPGSELQITEPLFINGETAPDYDSDGPPIVVLDGNSISGSTDDGLDIRTNAAGTRIHALGIVSFPDDGINFSVDNVQIALCYIGVDVDGTTAQGNGTDGIRVFGSSGVLIGQRGFEGGRNVIGGNAGNGISLLGGGTDNADIGGNYIGVGADGSTEVSNGGAGVQIASGTGHRVGYRTFAGIFGTFNDGNVISGNDGDGIALTGGTTTVLANRIGTTADGQSPLPNVGGIRIESDGNTIGPSSDGEGRNIISGNQFNGILIGIGGGASADNNVVQYNYIGVDVDGTTAISNGSSDVEAGIRFDQGSDNDIANNVIAGNNAHGILMGGDSFGNDIRANFIGTNRTFDDLGNEFDGVRLVTSPSSNTDETEVYDQNVIGYNRYGVYVGGDYHDITNNFIGTNDNGANLGNSSIGVYVRSTNTDVIVGRSSVGGTTQPGNVIGFNGGDGILLSDANNSFVRQNYVGTNANGTDLGNGRSGINIVATSSGSASDNRIGYSYGESLPSDPSANAGNRGNVIAFNGDTGIDIGGSGTAVNNNIRGNSIYQNGADNMTDIGIDLGRDGTTVNDNGNEDADSGPNNLQNFPVINSVNYNTSSGEVTIDYTVFTASGNADYGSDGLKVDFYAADSEQGGEGKTYLDTQFYNTPSSSKQKVIDLGNFSNVDNSDFFVATVTDASGNTSEFIGTSRQLPVELAAFEAQQDGDGTVQLGWQTASETNNAGFHVEHQVGEADDASAEWTTLDFIEGVGTTTEAQRYRFTVSDLDIGTHRFRLRQVDTDGTTHYSDAVEVRLAMTAAMVLEAPYPNPVRGQATLKFAVREANPVRVVLYDMLGRRVATLYDSTPSAGQMQTVQVEASTLASGQYIVRLEGAGTPRTQRLTVVR